MSYNRFQYPVLSSWNSLNRLASFGADLGHWFEQSFADPAAGLGWNPPLDLYDNKEAFVVTIEAPGLKKEDFVLSLHEGVLTVSGERKTGAAGEKGASFRAERPQGKFERRVTLPSLVKSDAVKATYRDGVLSITLPKAEEAKPRQIEVNLS